MWNATQDTKLPSFMHSFIFYATFFVLLFFHSLEHWMLNMVKEKRQAIIQQLHCNELCVEEEPKCSFVYNCYRQNAIVRCRTTQQENTPNKCVYIYLLASKRSVYVCRRYGNHRNEIARCNKPNHIKGFFFYWFHIGFKKIEIQWFFNILLSRLFCWMWNIQAWTYWEYTFSIEIDGWRPIFQVPLILLMH